MQRRAEILQMLGIDEWRLRGTPAAATTMPPASTSIAQPAAPPSALVARRARRPVPVSVPEPPPAQARGPVPADWDGLGTAVTGCALCGLHAGRTRVVFGVGDRAAEWMVIGEAPGAEEDRQGEPFVGRAGGLLNAMLRAAGLAREQVFIANVLKCRPPHNRDPRPEEIASCMPYLLRQVELVNPRIILAVGRIAAQSLLGSDAPIGRLRGQVHRFGPRDTPLVVTYHPAYLLRSPGEKRKAWEDLKLAMRTQAAAAGRAGG